MDVIFLIMKYYKGSTKKRFPKFDQQIMTLKKMSYEVWYIFINNYNIYFHNGTEDILLKKNFFHLKYMDFINSILEYYYLYKFSSYILKNTHLIKYIYMRYMPYSFGMKKLYKMCRNFNFIVEMSTHPILNEIKMEKNKFKKLYFSFSVSTLSRYSKFVSLFALIGQKQSTYLNRPSINITNGVDCFGVKKWIHEKNTLNQLHFIGVANLAKWHGYDRVIAGLVDYYCKETPKIDVFFHIVGREGDGSLIELKNIVEKSIIVNNVIFEGELYDNELDMLFNKCDFAIGSLGMHRINLTYGSTLKAKEYLSRGIPFVIGYEEISIPEEYGLYIRVAGNETAIDINFIIDFISKKDKASLNKEIALQSLSWETQFLKIFKFLEETNNANC